MELKSSSRSIRVLGCAGIVAGVAFVASYEQGFLRTFGHGILVAGLVFLILPLFSTAGRK